jgi:tRNA (cytidine/uridine-2'-O-)-methyltransferase
MNPNAPTTKAGAFLSPPTTPVLWAPHFHVVLVEPEIPNNTGNIGRTCVATGCRLHLVRPLGFELTEKACRRAGLDYWPRLDWAEHESWSVYERGLDPGRTWFLSTKSSRSVFDVTLRRGDHLVFGRETRGLETGVLEAHPARVVSLPLAAGERSLNLATAVCAVVYEGIRQLRSRGECAMTADGRLVLDSGSAGHSGSTGGAS